jgi:hypothetical protein
MDGKEEWNAAAVVDCGEGMHVVDCKRSELLAVRFLSQTFVCGVVKAKKKKKNKYRLFGR